MNPIIAQIIALSGASQMVLGQGAIPGQVVFFVDLDPDRRAMLEQVLNALVFSIYPVAVKSVIELPPGTIPNKALRLHA